VRASVADNTLTWGRRSVPLHTVTGLVERYLPWSGKGVLELQGAGIRIPMDRDYADNRRLVREHLGNRPMISDWDDGHFPASPLGLPSRWVGLVGAVLGALLLGYGRVEGALVLWLTWMAIRPTEIRPNGLQLGGRRIGWHELDGVRLERGKLSAWGDFGAVGSQLPLVLEPAVRAHLEHRGRVPYADPSIEQRYLVYSQRLTGLSFASVLGAGLLGIVAGPDLFWGSLWLVVSTAGLASSAKARSMGHGVLSVVWIALSFGVLVLLWGSLRLTHQELELIQDPLQPSILNELTSGQ